MAGPDPGDPLGRTWSAAAPPAAPPAPRIAIPDDRGLAPLTPDARRAFADAAERLVARGGELVEVDIAPLLDAGGLLYEGAFVALRHAAVGAFVDAHRDDVDPVVGSIIAGGGGIFASRLASDEALLDQLAHAARATLAGTDALLVPTAPRQPTLAEVAAEPVAVNRTLGTYSTFCNLLDLCAVAVPAGRADDRHFGVTVLAPAFHDAVVADVAALMLGEAAIGTFRPPGIELLVVGAHRRGQPLNTELTRHGARFLSVVRTSSEYRLHRLDTDPPKPGLERVHDGGVEVEGELWALAPAAVATLLARLPPPMALGPVRLSDGRHVVGFLCEPLALDDAQDISDYASWTAYIASAATAA
jgi:allophanate hydrolase